MKRFKAILLTGFGRFGCITLVPFFFFYSPSDFNTRRKKAFKPGHHKTSKANERFRCKLFNRKKAKAVFFKMGLNPVYHGYRFIVR